MRIQAMILPSASVDECPFVIIIDDVGADADSPRFVRELRSAIGDATGAAGVFVFDRPVEVI